MLSNQTDSAIVSCSIEELFAYHEEAAQETIWLSFQDEGAVTWRGFRAQRQVRGSRNCFSLRLGKRRWRRWKEVFFYSLAREAQPVVDDIITTMPVAIVKYFVASGHTNLSHRLVDAS